MSFDMIKKFVLHKDHAPWFIALLLAAALTTAGVIIFSAGGGQIQSAKAAGVACPFGTDPVIDLLSSTVLNPLDSGDYYDCTASTVHIGGSSTLTLGTDPSTGKYAEIHFGDLVVDAGSKISSDALGCAAVVLGEGQNYSTGPNSSGVCVSSANGGQGAGRLGRVNNTTLATYAYGGAHGGKGGAIPNDSTVAMPYGSSDQPLTFGASGGPVEKYTAAAPMGTYSSVIPGGAGGGIVKIEAINITLAGVISANGQDSSGASTQQTIFAQFGATCDPPLTTTDPNAYFDEAPGNACPQHTALHCGEPSYPLCTAISPAGISWSTVKSIVLGCYVTNPPSNCYVAATNQAGAGAGGSVSVKATTVTISGTGKFQAKGGAVTQTGGTGGAGGHIAVISENLGWQNATNLDVAGGTSNSTYNGSKGTAFVRNSSGSDAYVYHGFGYEGQEYVVSNSWNVDASATNQYCQNVTAGGADPTVSAATVFLKGAVDCLGLPANKSFVVKTQQLNGTVDIDDVVYDGAPESWFKIQPLSDLVPTTRANLTVRGVSTQIKSNIDWKVNHVEVPTGVAYTGNAAVLYATGKGCNVGTGPDANNVCKDAASGGQGIVDADPSDGPWLSYPGGSHIGVGGKSDSVPELLGASAYDASNARLFGAGGNGVPNAFNVNGAARGGGAILINALGNLKWHPGALIYANGASGYSKYDQVTSPYTSGFQSGGGAGGSINIRAKGTIQCYPETIEGFGTVESPSFNPSTTFNAKGGSGGSISGGGGAMIDSTSNLALARPSQSNVIFDIARPTGALATLTGATTARAGGGGGGIIKVEAGNIATAAQFAQPCAPSTIQASLYSGGTAQSPALAGGAGTFTTSIIADPLPIIDSVSFVPLPPLYSDAVNPKIQIGAQTESGDETKINKIEVIWDSKTNDYESFMLDCLVRPDPLVPGDYDGQLLLDQDSASCHIKLRHLIGVNAYKPGVHTGTVKVYDSRSSGVDNFVAQSFSYTVYELPKITSLVQVPPSVFTSDTVIVKGSYSVDLALLTSPTVGLEYNGLTSGLPSGQASCSTFIGAIFICDALPQLPAGSYNYTVIILDQNGKVSEATIPLQVTAVGQTPTGSGQTTSFDVVPSPLGQTFVGAETGLMIDAPSASIPGTVTSISVVALQEAPLGAEYQITPVFQFGPAGTVFNSPLTIRIPYSGSVANARIFWSSLTNPGTFEALPCPEAGCVETINEVQYAVGLASHFSYGYVAPLQAAVPLINSVTHAPAQALTTATMVLSGAGQVAVDGDATMEVYYRLATDAAPGNLLQTCPIAGAVAGTTYTCDSSAINLAAGQYVTTVKMTDSLAQVGEGTEAFEVYAPPSATVALNPASNIFTVNPLTVMGTGSDDKSVTSVLVAVDSSSLSYHSEQSCASSPCDLAIAADTLSPGTDYVATVTVTDVDGLTAVATENFSVFGPLSVTGSWTPELVARDIQVTLHGDAGYSLGVQKIEIRLDGTETSTPKKTCTFTTMKLTASCDYGAIVLAPGVHTLRVKVYGNDASTLTDTKTFTVDPVTGPPGAAVLAKTTSGNFSVGDTVTLYATATDDVAVKSLEVYLDDPTPSAPTGMPKKICPTPPLVGTAKTLACSISVGKLTAGTHTATARSFDAESSVSHTITFEVVNGSPVFVPATKPLLNFPTPTDGDSLIVTYKATDDLAVQKLEIYLNGALKTTYPVPPKLYTGKALQYSYTLGKLLSGDYTVSAIAYDAYGSTASEVTSFHVTNNAPVATGSATVVRNKVTTQVDQTTPATAFETVSLKGTGTDGRGVMRVEIYLDPQPGPLEGQTINKACDYTGTPVYTRTCASSALVRSMGTHVVGVRVRDNEGVWSEDNPAARTFNVALPASKIINISMVPNTTTTTLKYINLAFPAATIQPGGYSGTVTYDLGPSGLTLNSITPTGSGACLSNIVQNGQTVTATATNCSGTVYLKGMNLTAPDEPAGSTVAKNWPGVFTLAP